MWSAVKEFWALLWNTVRFLMIAIGGDGPYDGFMTVLKENNWKTSWVLFGKYCVLGDKKDANEVLTNQNFKKCKEMQNMLDVAFGVSLFNVNEPEEAQRQRTLVRNYLKDASGVMETVIENLIYNLNQQKEAFDVVPVVHDFAFDFMLRVFFGRCLQDSDEEAAFKKNIDSLITKTGEKLHMKSPKKFEAVRDACNLYIKQTLNDSMSNEDVDMMRGLAMAGYATVANLLSATLKCLADNPEYQVILRQVNDEDEGRMLAENAVLETGRLFPPVHSLRKTAVESGELPSGLVYEAGQDFMVLLWGGFSPSEEWLPQRWTVEKPDRPLNLLFSIGTRACTGRKQAMQLVVDAVSQIVTKFEITPGNTPALRMKNTMLYGFKSVEVKLQPL